MVHLLSVLHSALRGSEGIVAERFSTPYVRVEATQ